MWKLLNFKKGDLIVGIEGTMVRGICEIKEHGYKNYSYTDHNYAHSVGKGLKWVDWCRFRLGVPPRTSPRGFRGIKFLGKKNRKIVLAAWESINENDPWWPEEQIEATLKMDVTPRDEKVYFKHIKDSPGCRYVTLSDYLNGQWHLRNHNDAADLIAFDSIESLIKSGWVLD